MYMDGAVREREEGVPSGSVHGRFQGRACGSSLGLFQPTVIK